jgi:hypothetical protein
MIPGLIVLTTIALALAWWGQWLSRKPRVPQRLAAVLKWSFLVLTPVPAIGITLTYFGLRSAFAALESAPADQRARLLAEGISEAMNASSFAVIVLFAETMLLVFLTARYVWSKPAEPDVPGDPPYR